MNIKYIIKHLIVKSIYNKLGFFYYFNQKIFFPKNSLLFFRTIEEGIYEHANLSLISKLLGDKSFYFDVGANIGLMAIPIFKLHKTCRIVSFEPSPNTYPYLKKTFDNSSYKTRWTIIKEAASNQKNIDLDFYLSDSSNGAYDSLADTKRSNILKKIKIKTTTVDHIWEELGQPQVSVIKSDTEGADLLVLQGSQRCINKCRPYILVEWHYLNIAALNIKPEAILDYCQAIDYDCYALPNNNSLKNHAEVNIAIKFSENFLLSPKEKDVTQFIVPF